MKYNTRQREIEAVQWKGDNLDEILELVGKGNAWLNKDKVFKAKRFLDIHVCDGLDTITPGDYVFKENGLIDAMGKNIFNQIFERANQ